LNTANRKLPRNLFSSQVLNELRRDIILGKIPKSEKIIETTIAKQMKVSRGPVRNALYILEKEGLVTFLENGPTISNGFTLLDAEKLYELRAFLEFKAIELIFKNRQTNFQHIKYLNEELRKKRDDAIQFTQLDVDYHQEIMRLSGNKYLLQGWLSLHPMIEAILMVTNTRIRERGSVDWDKTYVIDHHENIMTALITGNLKEAILFLKEHLDIGEELIMEQLREIVKR
jgi:DNA-binding GntR family transcriptional regulator